MSNLVDILNVVVMGSVLITLIIFNKRLKVLENLPSIKDFLRSHNAKKKRK